MDTTLWGWWGRIMPPRLLQQQMATYHRELGQHWRAGAIARAHAHATAIWQDRPVMLLAWCKGKPQRFWSKSRTSGVWAKPWGMQGIHTVAAIRRVTERRRLISCRRRRCVEQGLVLRKATPRLLHLDYHLLNVLPRAYDHGGADWATHVIHGRMWRHLHHPARTLQSRFAALADGTIRRMLRGAGSGLQRLPELTTCHPLCLGGHTDAT